MTWVRNRVLDSRDQPVRKAQVSVFLRTEPERSHVGTYQGKAIAGPKRTQTDLEGWWRLNLLPNADIAPAGSSYLVLEARFPEHLIEVPQVEAADPDGWLVEEVLV